MRIDEFDYELPAALIAQVPAERRDASRLLVARRPAPSPSRQNDAAGVLGHRHFHHLPDYLRRGDVLVVNDARVLPARLQVQRSTGGQVELLVIAPLAGQTHRWRALARPARRVRPGDTLALGPDIELRVLAAGEGGERTVEFPAAQDVVAALEQHGRMPLPHYIHPPEGEARARLDRERYQTVYAATPGAVAAPTAGLHFTAALLQRLRETGVEIATVTLHVGPGTFRPVTSERVQEHRMDGELYEVPAATAAAVNAARAQGRRVIAVGTTATRTLEHAAAAGGDVLCGAGEADLFITPGYRFRVIDGMITNFHLPRSTPILLVAALLGRDRLLTAYREAVARQYRFYSYGDAMLVLPADH